MPASRGPPSSAGKPLPGPSGASVVRGRRGAGRLGAPGPDRHLPSSGWRLGDSVHVLLGRHRLHRLPGRQGRSPGRCSALPRLAGEERGWAGALTPFPVLSSVCLWRWPWKGGRPPAPARPEPTPGPPAFLSRLQQHVQDGRKENLEGFVKTFDKELSEDAHPGVFALDCEMVSCVPRVLVAAGHPHPQLGAGVGLRIEQVRGRAAGSGGCRPRSGSGCESGLSPPRQAEALASALGSPQAR